MKNLKMQKYMKYPKYSTLYNIYRNKIIVYIYGRFYVLNYIHKNTNLHK